uniref:ATP synthase F0 subunit 8 n=1 Tax=Emerita talpoida TaxID=101207 RepID=UPI002200D32D|nr:ATP synthase F0 subunit 8 [Emerita talpoida]UXL87264.1 ATP synthase F0 subunit 8 [Emerita talpoida]
MPQMAPILWLNMMFIFIMTFMVVMIINYYMSSPQKMSSMSYNLTIKQYNWSW